jgi:hypothetical protein
MADLRNQRQLDPADSVDIEAIARHPDFEKLYDRIVSSEPLSDPPPDRHLDPDNSTLVPIELLGAGHRGRRFLTLVAAAVILLAVVSITIVSTKQPGKPDRTSAPTTAAPFPTHLSVGDQLRLVADRAAEQPNIQLQADQALYSQASLSIVASVNNGAAQATIGLSVQKWSTVSGQTCTTLTAQPAQFASPAEQAAWVGLHLLVTPNPATANQCLQGGGGAGAPDAITGSGQLIDVSSLPTDSATLAQELESGTTGIPALDQLLSDEAAPNPGFQRAAMLLIGPTVGSTPQFTAALYQAIAQLPGVTALGPTTAHDGETGQGYASGPGSGQSTIVVDPSTGRLLEVSGLDDSNSLSSIAGNYLGDGGAMTVNEYSAQLQWLDPTGSPSVISLSDLPATLPVYVFATTRSGLTYDQALTPVHQVAQPYFDNFKSDQSELTDPSNTNSPGLFQWSFAGPGPIVDQFMQALRASGLFATVSEI